MFILDPSVAIKWFFTDEPHYQKADTILTQLSDNPDDFLIPDFFFIEFSAALHKRSNRDAQFVHSALACIYKLGIRNASTKGELLGDAVNIATRQSLSVYDALYVAVAKHFNAQWLTSDEKAVAALGSMSRYAKLLQAV